MEKSLSNLNLSRQQDSEFSGSSQAQNTRSPSKSSRPDKEAAEWQQQLSSFEVEFLNDINSEEDPFIIYYIAKTTIIWEIKTGNSR